MGGQRPRTRYLVLVGLGGQPLVQGSDFGGQVLEALPQHFFLRGEGGTTHVGQPALRPPTTPGCHGEDRKPGASLCEGSGAVSVKSQTLKLSGKRCRRAY